MSTFHPFPRLPLELRQKVWTMAREPRRVVPRGYTREKQAPAQPPVLLAVCRGSRAYLLGHHYVQAFAGPDSAQCQYVDFDIDFIYLSQYTLEDHPRELPLIQNLEVEGLESDTFTHQYVSGLYRMPALRKVVILSLESFFSDNEWHESWDYMMEKFYFRDDPVPFDVRILGPGGEGNSGIPEINRRNYLKVSRDFRRRQRAKYPDFFDPDDIVSDSDEEPGAPGGFRLGYHHVAGCNCSYLKQGS